MFRANLYYIEVNQKNLFSRYYLGEFGSLRNERKIKRNRY